MFSHSSSFQSQIPETDISSYENIILAKKLSLYQPSSLSLDDISLFQEKLKSTNKSENDKIFLLPSPKIYTDDDNNQTNTMKTQCVSNNSKFAKILGFNQKPNKLKPNIKPMQYELPNVKLIHTNIKTRKPLKFVEISSPKKAG